MDYSALRLETLALHEVLKASLPTDIISPTSKMEVAAWKQLGGCYRVLDMKVHVQTKEGEEASNDQWDYGSLGTFGSFIPDLEVNVERFCTPQCDMTGCCDCGSVLKVSPWK